MRPTTTSRGSTFCGESRTSGFLDLTSEERRLIAKIRYTDYRSFLVELDSSPPFSTVHIRRNSSRARDGYPILVRRPYADRPLALVYAYGRDGEPLSRTESRLRNALGGTTGLRVRRVMLGAQWNHFPHVDVADLEAGFHRDLQALQGENRTFYVGEIHNFANVWRTVDWSLRFMNRCELKTGHFPSAAVRTAPRTVRAGT